MSTDFRALCAELTAWAEKTSAHYFQPPDVLLRARAALAKADEPAVPQGREPATADLEKEFRYWWKETYGSPYFGTVPLVAVLLWTECVLARWGNPAPQPAAVTGRPSDEELWELYQGPGTFSPIEYARAVLARWGTSNLTQTRLSPADGEVAELVAWLREQLHVCLQAPWTPGIKHFGRAAELLECLSPPQPLANGEVGKPVAWMCPAEPYFDGNKWHDQWQVTLDQRLAEYWARPGKPTPLFTRAAELLQRQALVPVPVSERLPGPEDCDANGRCWWGRSESHDWSADWTFATYKAVAEFCEFSPRTTWLPAHALPLPEVGE